MGSAVNIEVNREAIGMNRSGMTLLLDLNLSRYPVLSFFFLSFFFTFSSFSGKSQIQLPPFRDYMSLQYSSFILIMPWRLHLGDELERIDFSRKEERDARVGKLSTRLSLPPFLSLLKRVDLSLSSVFFSFLLFVLFLYVSYVPCDSHEFSSGRRILWQDQIIHVRNAERVKQWYKSYSSHFTG